MKVIIVVLVVLLASSNANLLQNTLDSVAATTQAQALRDSFVTQLNQITAADNQYITQLVQSLNAATQAKVNEDFAALTPQLSVADAKQSAIDLAKSLTDQIANTTGFAAQTGAIINGVSSPIVCEANRKIQELGSRIFSGNLALKCFTDKVPKIKDDIAQVVSQTQTALNDVVQKTEKTMVDDLAAFADIYNDIQKGIQTGILDVVSLIFSG